MAVLLLLPVSIAMRMYMDIPLLLHNLATDCLPRSLSLQEIVYQPIA
jgi:hypothetical protein